MTIPISPNARFSIEERFWSKVEKSTEANGCWIWKAAQFCHTRYGRPLSYGSFYVGSRQSPGRRMVYAHRISWELAKGPIPAGLRVLHKCDNPTCVRPDHLFLGTQADNVRDMVEKRRGGVAKGCRHGSAKLTPEQVIEIRNSYVKGKRGSARALANRYGVAPCTITDVVTRTWRSLQGV
jgi:hypothetical protein